MTTRTLFAVLILLAGVTACGSDPREAPPPDDEAGGPASSLASVETGPLELLPTGGTGTEICARFTADEISALAGSEVGEGQVAGPLDSACAWDFTSQGIVMVQAMTPDFWSAFPQEDDPDYEVVDGIGNEAFVQPALVSGWTAAALYDDRLLLAEVSGSTATPELAVRILEGVVPRLAP